MKKTYREHKQQLAYIIVHLFFHKQVRKAEMKSMLSHTHTQVHAQKIPSPTPTCKHTYTCTQAARPNPLQLGTLPIASCIDDGCIHNDAHDHASMMGAYMMMHSNMSFHFCINSSPHRHTQFTHPLQLLCG
jgi:hypothetical protein